MLTTQPELEDGFEENPAANDNTPVKLELTSQVLNTDWQMMREINEGLEEETNA